MESNTEYENYKKRLEKFPCAFNLVGADKVTTAKLRSIQHNLDSELDINDNCENERIIKLNLLTWVRFRLDKQDEAVLLSNEAVDFTERKNIASLGNRFFLMWQTGDEFEATKCLKELEKMESEHGFDTRLNDALAEQAYYYSRLGGPNYLNLAIKIFSNLPETPINYPRLFGLGLVYRRITHANIFCSSSEHMTVQEYQKRAAECLFKVSDNADTRLRSLAYAQLATLRRCYPQDLSPEDHALFRGLGVMQLCEKALEHGDNLPTVLTQCGKAIKPINLDKAIEWLKKSVEIKGNSAAYHHLGICYKLKAEQAAYPKITSAELRDHDYMGQRGAESQATGQSHDVSTTSRTEHRHSAEGNTQYDPMNSAEMYVREKHPQVNYTRQQRSNRRGSRNYLPEHIGGNIITYDVQNMHGRPRNARNRGSFCERGGITSVSHYNPPDATSNFGSSRRSINGRRRSAQGIGLVRGNAQRTGRHSQNSNRDGRTVSGGEWEPKSSLKGSRRRYRSVIALKKDDENVLEAFKYFKKAIEITKENQPAALDLGLLLKETDQVDEALKQFNSITNNYNSLTGHRLIVISAFEQAGLCYLKLSEIKGNSDYKEMAKNKLTKAVSMAADLSIIMPELQGSHKDVWVAFTTLLDEIDKEPEPQIKEKIKVLELAREYWDIVHVIQKLKDTGHKELTNPDIIKTALDSYLKLGQLDNALGYHNLVSMNPDVKGSDWWNANPMRSLRVKVLLHAILERLREISDSPTVLSQQLFELVFGSCIGLRDPENDQQHDTAPVVVGDVLFVFDTDDSPDEEMRCPVVKAARCLRTLSTCLFGLETQENLKGTGEYGERCSIQLKEMLKYQVVIIVLGDDTRNRLFNAMLERVSYNKHEEAPPNQKILVIDAGLQGGKIPQCLQQFKSLRLDWDIGILRQLQTNPESWGGSDHISFTEIIDHVDVDAVLELFCFMIGQTWPCP